MEYKYRNGFELERRVAKHRGVERIRQELKSLQFLIIHHTATIKKVNGKYEAIDMANYLTEQRDGRNVCVHLHVGSSGLVTKWDNLIDFSRQEVRAGMHVSSSKWSHGGINYVGLNSYTIGIECSGNTSLAPLTVAQYRSLVLLVAFLQEVFPILKDDTRILRHTDVAPRLRPDDIGKKHFNWGKFKSDIKDADRFMGDKDVREKKA